MLQLSELRLKLRDSRSKILHMSDNLDEDTRKAVQSLFLDIDGNHDGQISAFELNLAMQMIGI